VEQFAGGSFFCKLGLRLMNARLSLESFNGALDIIGSRQALRREFGMRLPVLMYHNIGTAAPGSNKALTISPAQFRRQLQWLARRGYTGITASQWLLWCREARPLPDKPILICFDDAYADTAKHGLCILREEGFTGTVFVVSSEIGGTNTWDQANGVARQELMTADEIRYWAKHGIEFGAHGRTHADLMGLSPDEVMAEMVDSRDSLARLVGEPITSFAYPYGYYNDSVLGCAKQAFPLAFTCDAGLNDLRTDLNRLNRAEMVPFSSLLDPFFQVRIGYNPIILFRRTVGRWRRQVIARAKELLRVREYGLFRT
jgi:peptidoglycan/xylan/chitin deacetylase (PgdA/CDA1 family)